MTFPMGGRGPDGGLQNAINGEFISMEGSTVEEETKRGHR